MQTPEQAIRERFRKGFVDPDQVARHPNAYQDLLNHQPSTES